VNMCGDLEVHLGLERPEKLLRIWLGDSGKMIIYNHFRCFLYSFINNYCRWPDRLPGPRLLYEDAL